MLKCSYWLPNERVVWLFALLDARIAAMTAISTSAPLVPRCPEKQEGGRGSDREGHVRF